ncbi:MAG: polysaccharide export protein [Candidatus Symbiothrix sp.]|jgi:polysaccharide export outer membrane protein|nr:polysaccharide export protein [Candidatus Symbiothrix sp.]
MKLKIWLFSAFLSLLLSCQSVPQDIAYLQDLDLYLQSTRDSLQTDYEAKIKHNDQLLITVSAPVLDQSQVAQFNLPMNVFLTPGETTVFQSQAIQTYTVDTKGDIHFPVVGKISIAGLKRSEAANLIAEKISAYLPDPIVNLQIISFKVMVLGEVLKPGQVDVSDGRLTILDAIGAAQDMTIYGDRTNVLVVREQNGHKEIYRLDLTKASIIDSPYYYLQQNDVVYVEPNKTRKRESRFGSGENYTATILTVSFSAISVLVTLAGFVVNTLKQK